MAKPSNMTNDEHHEDDAPSRGAGTPSQREIKRLRRRTAEIVAQAVRDLRPGAPLQETRRLVDARCAAAGLPAPSPKALAAKIAEVRRFEAHPKMLILDRCYVETEIGGRGPEIATLHVAILHPPGRIMAYRLIAGPPEDAIDAELLIEVQSASGPHPDIRVRLTASGPTESGIRTALSEAQLTTTGRTTRWAGTEAKDALGRSLLPDRIRIRLPRGAARARWAGQSTLAQLRIRIDEALRSDVRNGAEAAPAFGLARPRLAPRLVEALRRLTRLQS